MNHTAIETTARLAALHRADVAREVAAARTARRVRPSTGPAVTDVPTRWRIPGRWLPAPRPAV